MKFDKLHNAIPYARGGATKILSMRPYPDIKLMLPGRHAEDTDPIGGDFVVCTTDKNMDWKNHQFTHTDLFADLTIKAAANIDATNCLMGMYLEVIKEGEDPDIMRVPGGDNLPGIDYVTFLRTVQCLAIAEHRRYHRFETQYGGRYLPFRFGAGIVEGLWSPVVAAGKEKYGRPGVEQLERLFGTPLLTRKLME